MMVPLTLPYPVSANRYWTQFVINGRAMQGPSTEAKKYKREVAYQAMLAGIRKPIEGRVIIETSLHPKLPADWKKRYRDDPERWEDTVQCLDLDNSLKVMLDAIKGIVIEDDKLVWQINARRREPLPEPCAVIVVRPIPRYSPLPRQFELPRTAETDLPF